MAAVLSTKQIVDVRGKFSAVIAALTETFVRTQAKSNAAVRAPASPKELVILAMHVETGGAPGATLHLCGELTKRSSHELTAAVAAAQEAGACRLTVDMSDVSKVSLAGIFALHNAARTFSGQAPLNDEDGWSALRQMKADGLLLDGAHLRVTNATSGVREYLTANGIILSA